MTRRHLSNWTIEDVDRQERPETAIGVAFSVVMFLVVLAVLGWLMGSATKWEREHGCVEYECVYEVY